MSVSDDSDMARAQPVILPVGEFETAELVDLARSCLGEGRVPRTDEFWNWKHRDNPFGASLGLVARTEDMLAGMRMFMRWTLQSKAGTHPVVRAVDTATHPA